MVTTIWRLVDDWQSIVDFEGRQPEMRQQLRDLTGTLRGQACQHILQIGVRVMPVELCRLYQAHHRGCALSSPERARK